MTAHTPHPDAANPETAVYVERWLNAQDEVDRLTAELVRWRAECDQVGVPHDPAALVKHHRDNAKDVAEVTLQRQVQAIRDQRDQALNLLADAIPDPDGAIAVADWEARVTALADDLGRVQ